MLYALVVLLHHTCRCNERTTARRTIRLVRSSSTVFLLFISLSTTIPDAKRVKQLAGKTSISLAEAAAAYSAIQSEVVNQPEKKWYKRSPRITKRNLFRVAIILLLRSKLHNKHAVSSLLDQSCTYVARRLLEASSHAILQLLYYSLQAVSLAT